MEVEEKVEKKVGKKNTEEVYEKVEREDIERTGVNSRNNFYLLSCS